MRIVGGKALPQGVEDMVVVRRVGWGGESERAVSERKNKLVNIYRTAGNNTWPIFFVKFFAKLYHFAEKYRRLSGRDRKCSRHLLRGKGNTVPRTLVCVSTSGETAD